MSTDTPHWDREHDASGLICPLPVLRARKQLQSMQAGEVLAILATDPAAVLDMPHFCSEAGHTLVATCVEGDARRYFIRKRRD